MATRQEKIVGGLYGLLIGDALGVPYEFHPARDLPPLSQIEFDPPENFRRAHSGTPLGTWSDDGAQALVLLHSLLECDALDLNDFSKKLVAWYDKGFMAVDNRVFDVGVQTGQALANLKAGIAPEKTGPASEYSNGNGSLMRVLPLALWHRGSDEELVHDAHRQSLPTHGHARSQICCALYCLWARRTMEDKSETSSNAWSDAASTLRAIYGEDSSHRAELEFNIRPDEEMPGKGSGYVVDCLRSARWSTLSGGFERAVKTAVALGNDTDTTACVAGGIAGVRDGLEAIPARWRDNLRGQEILAPLLEQLLQRAS